MDPKGTFRLTGYFVHEQFHVALSPKLLLAAVETANREGIEGSALLSCEAVRNQRTGAFEIVLKFKEGKSNGNEKKKRR